MPSCLKSTGKYFLTAISTICTADAMTTMKAIVRRYGVVASTYVFRNQALTAVMINTKVLARPRRQAVSTFAVTPKNEHSPRNITSVKLLTRIVEKKIQARLLMPWPSATARTGPTLAANASARPSSRQLATMSGMNGPSAFEISGKVAARIRSASVTKVAMIRMYEVMRTSLAMYLRNSDTNRPEPTSTNSVAIPMAMPLASMLVTAIVGH